MYMYMYIYIYIYTRIVSHESSNACISTQALMRVLFLKSKFSQPATPPYTVRFLAEEYLIFGQRSEFLWF